MRVDVSEIKSYRSCKRKWKLSSRNAFHLTPMVTPKAFSMGTLFHESLHSLYLGSSVDKVMEMVKREMDPSNDVALLAMVPGYAENVMPNDLERYQVLDIEHKFSFCPMTSDGEIIDEDLQVCGSIDMIALEKDTNKIFGFEHKTAKNYRDTTFMWMDEQPRVYTFALQIYVRDYNRKLREDYDKRCIEAMAIGEPLPEEPEPATLGGIYINEVKKLLRKFDYRRTLCEYPKDDLDNFMEAFFGTCCACKHSVDTNDVAAPAPSYMGCQMCEFSSVCCTYMYSTLDKAEVLSEFSEELRERDVDHLDEKVERNN